MRLLPREGDGDGRLHLEIAALFQSVAQRVGERHAGAGHGGVGRHRGFIAQIALAGAPPKCE